ncbi:hypothetical protein SG34_031115 [Thalassomonas viridans]|uniref:Uncharacterized protein n=1 Tax=Thalassomonas viridans TaxID=137584 RepID=A0AAE9ZAP7_9GAMM|nr:hypothetical protein [Thalassomonas viridans]WDE09217.1 hypothetical protein SG34_031115 [Thalassomonas viridans]
MDDEIAARETEAKNLQIENVLGYWAPQSADNKAFEFLPSVFDGTLANEIMTGKIYQNDEVVRIFAWDINADGQINLGLFSPTCVYRPITSCEVTGTMVIEASGSDIQNAYWEIRHDQGNDGDVDEVFGDTYRQKQLDLSARQEGELYLVPTDEYFSSRTVSGLNSSAGVELALLGSRVSSSKPDFPVRELAFEDDAPLISSRTFDVSDVGYQDFVIETSFENVALRPSANDSFALSYELYRKVIIPEGIDESSINFDGFSKLDKRTSLVRYIDTFIDAPEINAEDQFFSHIYDTYYEDGFGEKSTNDIFFDSATTGVLTAENVIESEKTRQLNFEWERSADGEIRLNIADGSLITLNFIREIVGGYAVLMTTEDKDRTSKNYYVHDFVKSSDFQISDDMFPGRYQLENSDGYSTAIMTFTADGVVDFDNIPNLGGHWFINDQGELISFECTDLQGIFIDDYNTCLDSFEFIGTSSGYTEFSHIRKLKFLHRDGDDFLLKYNAGFWGGPFGFTGTDYREVNWTYRMKRIGDVRDEASN